MKKILAIALILAVAGAAFAQAPKDGFYFAEQTEFSKSGWRYQAVLEVKGGKIVSANWNGVNNLGLADKKTVAKAGQYGMAKVAKQGEWDVQAARVEAALANRRFTSSCLPAAMASRRAVRPAMKLSRTRREFSRLWNNPSAGDSCPDSFSRGALAWAKAAPASLRLSNQPG